jgi:hypothetical protein
MQAQNEKEKDLNENENVKAYYELMAMVKAHEAERKWERKQKNKLLRLQRRITRMKENLAKMQKEYSQTLYDDKLFITNNRRREWLDKHPFQWRAE